MITCRYQEISPVCLAINNSLLIAYQTKEHLIPKKLLKSKRYKGIIEVNSNSNIDISCTACNNLKTNNYDLEFAYKLQFYNRHNISILNKDSLHNSLDISDQNQYILNSNNKLMKRFLNTLIYGHFKLLTLDKAIINKYDIIIHLDKNSIHKFSFS